MAMDVLLNAEIVLRSHIYCVGKALFHMCNNVFFSGSNGTKVRICVCDNVGEFGALCSGLIPPAPVQLPGDINTALPFLVSLPVHCKVSSDSLDGFVTEVLLMRGEFNSCSCTEVKKDFGGV